MEVHIALKMDRPIYQIGSGRYNNAASLRVAAGQNSLIYCLLAVRLAVADGPVVLDIEIPIGKSRYFDAR